MAYVEPCRRPTDARYGDNPYRAGYYFQFQVILKPPPDMVVEMYIESLERLGLRRTDHDIRFVEDNWESPTLGASGLGWEVWLDGTRSPSSPTWGGWRYPGEAILRITYGLERLAAYIRKGSMWDVEVSPGLSYKDVYLEQEKQFSALVFSMPTQTF